MKEEKTKGGGDRGEKGEKNPGKKSRTATGHNVQQNYHKQVYDLHSAIASI